MRDNWITHNTDKLLLFSLVIIFLLWNLYVFVHGGNEKQMDFSEQNLSVVLGALILILTGRISRADGQTASGTPPGIAPPYPARPPEASPAPADPKPVAK